MPNEKPKTNIYDKIFRENGRKIFLALIEQLYQLDIKSFEALKPKFPSTSENEVDFLYEITLNDGNKQILHIEFQAANDSNMLIVVNLGCYYLNLISHECMINIYNVVGQLVRSPSFENVVSGIINLNMDHLPDCIYFIEVGDGKKSKTKQFIIQK